MKKIIFLSFLTISLQVLGSDDIERYERSIEDRLQSNAVAVNEVIKSLNSRDDEDFEPTPQTSADELLARAAPPVEFKSEYMSAFSKELKDMEAILDELPGSSYVKENKQCGRLVQSFKSKEMAVLKEWEAGFESLPFATAEERIDFFAMVTVFSMSGASFLSGNIANVYMSCLYPETKPILVFDLDKMGSDVRWASWANSN